MMKELHFRQRAIKLRLAGNTVQKICQSLERSRRWFHKWWQRWQSHGADGLRELPRTPKRQPRRFSKEIRGAIVAIRDRIVRRRGSQARYRLAGAPTIRHELEVLGYRPLPSSRQIERVLQQSGRTSPAFRLEPDAKMTGYPAPVAKQSNQVHQMDLIGPRYLKGARGRYHFLTCVDIYDHAVYVEFQRAPRVETVLEFLVHAWQRLGVPKHLQVDNDILFGNPRRWAGSINRFIRLALRVGVELIFIPEGEPYRNGVIERFNGWLQERLFALRLHSVWQVRRELRALMQVCLDEHIHPHLDYRTTAQVRRRISLRRLPANFCAHRRPLPIATGRVTFIRRVRRSGRITVLNVRVLVGKRRHGQYVRAVLFTRTRKLKLYHHTKLVKEIDYPIRGIE